MLFFRNHVEKSIVQAAPGLIVQAVGTSLLYYMNVNVRPRVSQPRNIPHKKLIYPSLPGPHPPAWSDLSSSISSPS